MQKPTAATFLPALALEFVDSRLQIRQGRFGRQLAQGRRGFGGIGERARASLRGQQVDRQCGVADAGESPGHRADVVVESLVLVDDEDSPRGSAAGAQAACSSPPGPAQVIGVDGTVFSDPGGDALTVAGSLDVAGAFDVGCLFSPHAVINAVAAAVPTPSSASRRKASRLDSNPST